MYGSLGGQIGFVLLRSRFLGSPLIRVTELEHLFNSIFFFQVLGCDEHFYHFFLRELFNFFLLCVGNYGSPEGQVRFFSLLVQNYYFFH